MIFYKQGQYIWLTASSEHLNEPNSSLCLYSFIHLLVFTYMNLKENYCIDFGQVTFIWFMSDY